MKLTVLVRDPLQLMTRQLRQLAQEAYATNQACGVILTTCTNTNPRFLVQLESFLNKHEAELEIECYFDDHSRVLGVILAGRKLASTHYTALVCKEFLERYDLLDGQLIAASFPESGELTEPVLSQLIRMVKEAKEKTRDIRLFVNQPSYGGVSTILVADTEETSREFIKLRFEMKGYEVHEARDGSEALAKFSQYAPDVVITELNLPVLDGYQLIHKIKEEHEDGKVIVLTDKHLTKDMNRAFEIGASDYVTKPFSFSELEWRIKRLQFV